MTMKIRRFQPHDAMALAQIFHDAVHTIAAQDYSADQLSAWSSQPVESDTFIKRVSDGRDVFVAINDSDEPIGFIELERNGHIDCFYCRPDIAGTGIGTTLYQHLERTAYARNITTLFVEASEPAKRFFLRHGYTTEYRRDFKRKGVNIHNYLMRKPL